MTHLGPGANQEWSAGALCGQVSYLGHDQGANQGRGEEESSWQVAGVIGGP